MAGETTEKIDQGTLNVFLHYAPGSNQYPHVGIHHAAPQQTKLPLAQLLIGMRVKPQLPSYRPRLVPEKNVSVKKRPEVALSNGQIAVWLEQRLTQEQQLTVWLIHQVLLTL